MARANIDPSEHTRIGTQIGLVFQDQRTGDYRRVVYVDEQVVLIRDEDGNTTLTDRESFETELGTRYRPRPDADVDVDGGQYDRLRERLTVYAHSEGRKASHKADALREALDLLTGDPADLDDELVDVTKTASDADGSDADGDAGTDDAVAETDEIPFEEVPGIGPETAGNLRASGYVTEGDVRSASDEAMLAVAGLGPSTLENLREFLD